MGKERLDKIIASRGTFTRNEVRKIIKDGSVSVDGAVITDFAYKFDAERADIRIFGSRFENTEHTYIMLNKPKGVVSASDEGSGGSCITVVDILPESFRRKGLFPAGRLDKDTTGFCLITDDGDFAHRILSPSCHVKKTYIARVDAPLDFGKASAAFKSGITLSDGTVLLSAELYEMNETGDDCYKVVIREGKYHQIKRMFSSLGAEVTELKRIKIGGLSLDETLKEGDARLILQDELNSVVEFDE